MRIRFISLSIPFFVWFRVATCLAAESCCPATAETLPVPMPAGQTRYDYGGIFASAFTSGLQPPMGDCPLPVDTLCDRCYVDMDQTMTLDDMVNAIAKASGVEPDPAAQQLRAQMHGTFADYVFKGELSVAGGTVIDGQLYGVISLTMKMVDNCPSRNNTVKEGSTTWDGTQFPGISNDKGAMADLGKTFMPLDEIIYDYERTPATCTISPEKDRVKVGDRITVTVQGLQDGQGRTPPAWQKILVKVDEGEILNGRPQDDDWYVFDTAGGSVEIQYKAPETCPPGRKDKMQVWSTCETCPERFVNFLPEKEIATKEIELSCELRIVYNHSVTNAMGGFTQTITTTGSVPFHIEDSGELAGSGSLSHTVSGSADDCVFSGGGSGHVTISGQVVPKESGDPDLEITFNETWYQGTNVIWTCPDYTQTIPYPSATNESRQTFPMTNGHQVTQPYSGAAGSGTLSWTLYTE